MVGLAQNLSFILLGEDKSASKSMHEVESTATKVTGVIGGAFSKLGGVIGGEFGHIVGEVGQGITELGEKGGNLSKTLLIAGAAATAAGIGLMNLGSGEKQATDQLNAAIKAAGDTTTDYTEKIEEAVAAGQNFDHEAEDTKKALTVLTEATGSTEDALSRMALVTDLAAAKHISLEDAAGLVAKILGGAGGRTLKAYGITMEENADGTKNVEGALAQLAAKLDGQASASVNNFASQVDIVKTKVVDWAKTIAGPLGQALTAIGPVLSIVGVAMDLYKSRKLAATAATLANSVAVVTNTAATEAATAAQVGLNVAMDANPVLLVTGALVGLAAIVGGTMLLNGTQDNTAATADYTSALQGETAAIDDNLRAVAAKHLLDDGSLAAAKQLGISGSDLVDSLLGNADAQDRVNQKLAEAKELYTVAGRPIQAMSAAQRDAKQAADLIATSLGTEAASMSSAKASQDLLNASLDDAAASLDVAERQANAYAASINGIPTSHTLTIYQDTVARSYGKAPAHAAGGIVTSPQMGIVGESGPEAIIPLNAGRTGMGLGGGGGAVNVTVNVAGIVAGTGDQMAKAIQTALVNAFKSGKISRTEFATAIGVA